MTINPNKQKFYVAVKKQSDKKLGLVSRMKS